MFNLKIFKYSAITLLAMTLVAVPVRSQDASTAKQDPNSKQDAAKQDESKQETPTTSVAPASAEVTPNTLDAHVGEKVKFSAVAKDSSGAAIEAKPRIWFAATFDVAGADQNGEVSY